MARRFTMLTTVSFGGDVPTAEYEVEFSFEVVWGSPETGRFGPPELYDPGSPTIVEDIRIEKIDGKARPWRWEGYSDDQAADLLIDQLGDDHGFMIEAAAARIESERPDGR